MNQAMNKNKWNALLQLLKKGIRHLFLHNGGFKLLAILISIVLWAGLISQDPNVTRNKTFQNVKVSIQNTDKESLKRRGLIITSDTDEIVSVTASVPQLQYENAEVTAYDLKIDPSGIRTTGEQELKIQSKDHSVYGEVVNINPSTITVNVENYLTYTFQITVKKKGETPEGWYITDPTAPVEDVSVSGPASILNEIKSAEVTLDLDTLKWQEGTIRPIAEIKLYNRYEEEITSPLLTITSDASNNNQMPIVATILPTQDFNLREMIQIRGEPAEGYRTTGEPAMNAEVITIAGTSEKLQEIKELPVEQRAVKVLEENSVDISGLTETYAKELNVKTLTISKDKAIIIQPDNVYVTVEIVPVEEEAAETDNLQGGDAPDQAAPEGEPIPAEPQIDEP